MLCPRCGNEVDETYKICLACGEDLKALEEKDDTQRENDEKDDETEKKASVQNQPCDTPDNGAGDNRRPPYGNPQYGQPPYGRPPYGQPPYGNPQYGQPPYGRPPYGQPPYGNPQYGQPPYGRPPYGQPPYGNPQYGQPPYGYNQGYMMNDDKPDTLLNVLSFLIPLLGIILYFVEKDKTPIKAKAALKWSLISVGVNVGVVLLVWFLTIALMVIGYM